MSLKITLIVGLVIATVSYSAGLDNENVLNTYEELGCKAVKGDDNTIIR